MSRKSGRENRLTGQIGEYLVVAELARRDHLATTFAGNVPDYDIIATDRRGRHVSVQVKASNSESWQFNILKFCQLTFKGNRQIMGSPHRLRIRGLVVVFVIISRDPKERDRFFILEWTRLRNIIVSAHRAWLNAHNGIRPRNPKSLHTAINVSQILRYENCWDVISRNLH